MASRSGKRGKLGTDRHAKREGQSGGGDGLVLLVLHCKAQGFCLEDGLSTTRATDSAQPAQQGLEAAPLTQLLQLLQRLQGRTQERRVKNGQRTLHTPIPWAQCATLGTLHTRIQCAHCAIQHTPHSTGQAVCTQSHPAHSAKQNPACTLCYPNTLHTPPVCTPCQRTLQSTPERTRSMRIPGPDDE